ATGASAISVDSGNSAADVNLVITAPAGFAGTLATTGGTISVAPTGNGTLIFANSGVSTATLNLNGGPVSIASSSSVSVGGSVTLSSDNTISISTPQLNLDSLAVVKTSGSSAKLTITSPVGSNLTIQLPSGSSAMMETPGYNHAIGLAPALAGPAGSINFTPAPGQSLTFSRSGLNPATLNIDDGLFVSRTTNATNTVG